MANEDKKDFNAMLHNSKDITKLPSVKSLREEYAGLLDVSSSREQQKDKQKSRQ